MHVRNDDINLNGFNAPYRRDRQGDNHEGTCVNVNEYIYSQHRPDLEVNDFECFMIETCTKSRKFILGNFYRPSNYYILLTCFQSLSDSRFSFFKQL